MANGKDRQRRTTSREKTRDLEAVLPAQREEMAGYALPAADQLEKLALEGLASGEPCVVDAEFWKTRHAKLAQQTRRVPPQGA